jgi:DNA-binding NtrC family response regulator
MTRARVLAVDDKVNMLKLCREILSAAFDVETASDGQMAFERLESSPFDVVLTDVRIPLVDGRQLLDLIRRRNVDASVVLMTGYGTIEGAVDAMRGGAFDYVRKPFEPTALIEVVRAAAEHSLARKQARELCSTIDARFGMAAIVGRSAAMTPVFAAIERARRTSEPVLVLGEVGTGRTLLARVIHDDPARHSGPFVVVHAQSTPPARLRSLFFRGSHEADDGTLLIREIDAVPLDLQRELAHRLDEKLEFRMAAVSALELHEAVAAGRFDVVLWERLQPGGIKMPPLRERREDIPLLAAHFVAKHAPRVAPSVLGIMPAALDLLLQHDWPDNVRGLEIVIERALAACRGETILRSDIALEISPIAKATRAPVDPLAVSYREALALARERTSQQYTAALLRTCDGNVTRAADLAGLERESVHRLMRRYGIRSEDFKPPLRRGGGRDGEG